MSIEKFGGKDQVELEWLKNLRKEKLRAILARQVEERLNRPQKKIEELTNAEVADLKDFKDFCAQMGIVPTKRQAGKRREEFIRWLNESKEK